MRWVRCGLWLWLLYLSPSAVWANADGTETDVCRQASEAVISAQSQWGGNAAKIAEEIIAPSQRVFNVDCLSRLTYGIRYSISSIFAGFDLEKMICRALESVVRRYSDSIRYSASLPYGILGIEIGGNVGIEPGGGGGGGLFESGILITGYDENRVDTGSVLDAIYQSYEGGTAPPPTSMETPSVPAGGVSPSSSTSSPGPTPYRAGGNGS